MKGSLPNKATIRSWCMYDWANSVYSLIVTSSLFPVYYGLVTKSAAQGNMVSFFGFNIPNSALFSYAVSASFLLAGILSPFLSSLSDLGGHRRRFLGMFCTLGSLSCMALYGFSAAHLEWGILTFVLAAVGYSSSIVFYNSFLPSITTPDHYARVSARGFAMGYMGSVLLLVMILLPVLVPGLPLIGGMDFLEVCRYGFLATGLWWLGFGWFAISGLPEDKDLPSKSLAQTGTWERLRIALKNTRNVPGLARFLVGFFFVNTGVQTIMYLAAIFGDIELHLSSEKLILTILILQVVAIGGANLFSRLSRVSSDRTTLLLACGLWVVVCLSAWQVQTENQFFVIAGLVGLVMGGSQSMMRSTFTRFLPHQEKGKAALYGFFDLLDKFSTVLGTLVFGLVNQLVGTMRVSALVLTVFFVLGAFFLKTLHPPTSEKNETA